MIAIDTGYGQMDFKLRQDPRVRLLEKTNARYITEDSIGEKVDIIVIDVAFISATLVLPPVVNAAFPIHPDERPSRQMIVLVKPQFEAGREFVGKGGIVRDESARWRRSKGEENVAGTERRADRCDRIADPWRGRQSRVPSSAYFEPRS